MTYSDGVCERKLVKEFEKHRKACNFAAIMISRMIHPNASLKI